MRELRLKDKVVFDRFFLSSPQNLSMYSFASIFVWRKFFKIKWEIIEGSLCVFFANSLGCFMPIAPLGNINQKTISQAFKVMDSRNCDKQASRIENIPEINLKIYKDLDLKIKQRFDEYIYDVSNLTKLSGKDFKTKRSTHNYFVKNYNYSFEKLDISMKDDCLKVYQDWAHTRSLKYNDPIYQACLEDTFCVQKEAFEHLNDLGFSGWVVKVDNHIKGYSLGIELNKQIFFIMFETADLEIKGLAQFLFKSFCQNLSAFKFVNAGDDSGFLNLKTVKQSYKPAKVLKSFACSLNALND
jgi:hypothetical protein